MHISELYKSKRQRNKSVVSFEIFPPKKDNYIGIIYETLEQLKDLNPDFISVTYGAGGSGASNRTAEISSVIKNKYHIEPLAHLTSIASDKIKVSEIIQSLKAANIENVLALRGDIPAGFSGEPSWDYCYATDLIRDIKPQGLCIGAACYPEAHIDCDSLDTSLDYLKQKEDAGAEFFVTQLFFDNALFYNFLERARKKNIRVPISAGIMPFMGKGQIQKMIFMCGASLPAKVIKLLNKYENDPESLRKAGIDYACQQAYDLVSQSVDGVHIYTMNHPEIAQANIAALQSLM